MATWMRRRVESMVLPVATHPGKSGTEAPQSLAGSLLMRTRYRSLFTISLHIVAKLAADGDTAWLGRVLELTMAASCNHQRPAIILQHPKYFPNLHPATLSNAGPQPRFGAAELLFGP